MSSLILDSVYDRIAYTPLWGQNGSIKKSAGRYSKRCLRTQTCPWQKTLRGRLLEQLEVCCEELNVAIMAELEERERINQELRDQVHQELDIARGLIYYNPSLEGLKKVHTKLESIVIDRSKRVKSDNLRKLLDSIKILQIKAGINEDKTSKSQPAEAVTSTTSTPISVASSQISISPVKVVIPIQSPPIALPPKSSCPENEKSSEPVKLTEVVPAESTLPKNVGSVVVEVQKDKPAEEEIRPPREIISEQAKLRQKEQIPWRTPTRLEPYRDPRKPEKAKQNNPEKVKKTPATSMVEPLPLKEPERLALRYKTKIRKRPADEPLPPADAQFKKPFAIPDAENGRPLFQRRHHLAASSAPVPYGGPRTGNISVPSRDPRNYGDYCNRRMTLMQNRARFERQNQQYFPPQRQQQHEQPGSAKPVAAAHPFAVPAPVTVPAPVAPTVPAAVRPPAPKASVAPNSTRPAAPVPATPVPAVVRSDTRKTNPVYSNDEPIRLGKKDEQQKKQVLPSKPVEDPKPMPIDEETSVEKKPVEEEKPVATSKTVTQKEKDNALKKDLLDMLKELGDEKAKQILDVMGKNSDEESEKPTEKEQEEKQQPKRAKAVEKKTGKKFKRIRSKPEESSSEDETQKKEKEQPKKEKAKPAKRASGGSREVSALIENSSDWMAKGNVENHYTRRRGTSAAQQLISPPRKDEEKNSTKISSDEEGSSSSKQQLEDSLLTVAKVVPAAPAKGKQKAKETTFVYNDKKTVHCNSNYSSNCAICSFNGSAIVDHYVYDHKTYEVFVSRVSPKMADIIRSDLFMTNGTLVTGDDNEERIRFKCYFCLAPKELGRVEWTDHLSSHTGEYRYRCTSCPVMSRTEELGSKFFHEKSCLKPTLAIYNNIEFEDNHLYGFICDACNYIQIRRVNMERHLKREHPSSDVTCSRFSILNYKVETKPIVDEELLMLADLQPSSSIPTVMIPFSAKSEPMDTYEIVNQPFTEDEEMPDLPTLGQLPRRTDIRLESVHIGQVGGNLPNQLAQLPFAIKTEPGLQLEAISSSNSYESPMSPEPPGDPSEAQASIPVLQIESITGGGIDFGPFTVKQEKPDDEGCESDASDATVDLNVSPSNGVRQCATDGNQQNDSSGAGATKPTEAGAGGDGTSNVGSSGDQSGGGGGGAAGAGGDDGDDRKKEEFPLPFKIKVEKDEAEEEEEKKKKLLQGVTTAMEKVNVKTEKTDCDTPEVDTSQYDFVELVLDSKRMQYVAYVERNSEALFLCILPSCKFITKVADSLSNHIKKKHSRVLWDGYCQICRSQITPADCSITEEFQHLLTIHARKKTPPLETPASNVAVASPALGGAPNVIRIRKMPGDTLSLGDLSNPPPLMPIMSTVQPIPQAVQSFTSPMIIPSGATISPAPVPGPQPLAMNQLYTPTHTIPAQIRPITATVGPNITVTPVIRAPNTIGNAAGGPLPVRTVRLKPWTNMVTTKSQDHCREMLEELSLHCLFKCMSRTCAFTSNSRMMMAQHLNNHDYMYQRGQTNQRKCWLECAYCDLIAPTSADLLVHIDAEHANCGFQCNLCFYRSRDPTNVVVHQKDHHPASDIPKKILIMPDNLKSFGDEEWRSMQESLRQHVLPLHCTICKESFYILSAYMTHLTSHPQMNISCQVCNATIDKKIMARHLLQHSIGLYECVYCLFGANTKSTMALHVSNAHSSKPLYCCVRYNKQRSDGVEYPPNKIESMELKTMSCTVSPDLFKRCNYSQAELNFKPPDLEVNRTMAYKRVRVSGTMIEPVATTTASNIQIQITDEAGRPLIISIPVKNAPPSGVPGPSTAPLPIIAPAAPAPAVQSVQMPMISTVQGGVRINPSPPLIQPQPAPLPVISSVQGSLPALTAISQLKQPGLPVISNVQSIAAPPPLPINPIPRSSSPAVSTTSGACTYAIPAKISAVSSTTPSTTSSMYTTTVAEADTQSTSAELVGGESDGSGSKCSTPVLSQSPAPSNSVQVALPSTTVGSTTTTVAATTSKKFTSTTQIRIDFLFNGSIDKFDRLEKKVSEMIKHTGFCGQELNACGVEKCNSRYSDPVKLNLHLLKHHSVSSYKCFHCVEKFKTAHELITHIKTHGRHRYLCFLCDQKSHFLKMMIVHVQHDHKSSDVILTYLHPKKRDIHNDLVVICPQNVTQVQLQDYINNILGEDTDGPQVPKKKKFAPSEIDQLPVEEIFGEDLLCGNCDYATKIRKNMKRHLEKHLDTPVEGVPVVVTPTLDESPTASSKSPDEPTHPQQVELDKLYQCGICKFECPPVITVFRTHLYRVHRHEKIYRCTHCNMIVNNGFLCIDKIINHLKLHREKLYKCSECEYYRDEKYLIPQHLKQNHSGVPGASVVAIREPPTPEDNHEWQCDLCETIRSTRAEMVLHMTGDHKLSDKQYKCSYCSYKSSDNDSFKMHFAESHPKCEILIISLFHSLPSGKTTTTPAVTAPVTSLELPEPGCSAETAPTRKKFSCGSEGCSFASLNLQIVKKHFLDQHPDESLVVFDDTGIEREKRKRFDYFVKYGCGYCLEKFAIMDDVIEHWYNTHRDKDGEKEKPLTYKLFKLVRCIYCDKLSTYDEIKEHSATAHPGQLFACIDHQNVFKCGECPHILESLDSADLLKHFKIYHSISKVEDPCDYIDDEFLSRMLEQNNNCYTCNHCMLVYNSRFEYECHIAVCEFAGLPSSFKTSPKSDEIRFNCSGCDASFSSEFTIADHIRTHLTQYSCSFCKREFKELHRLDQHQIEFHNVSRDAQITLKDLNQHRLFFTKIQMLFPNGLLLSKMDAHRTVCGSVEDIMNHVRSINHKEVFELKLKKALQTPLIYENEYYETVETTCQDFLARQSTHLVLALENLKPNHIAEIQEQVYALHKATQLRQQKNFKRGRPRKTKRVVYSESPEEDDDEYDCEWTPENKRIGWSRPGSSRPTVVKKEYEEILTTSTTTATTTPTSGRISSRNSSSSSDDELLINLKKEKPEEIIVKMECQDEMENTVKVNNVVEEEDPEEKNAPDMIIGMPMDQEDCEEERFEGFE